MTWDTGSELDSGTLPHKQSATIYIDNSAVLQTHKHARWAVGGTTEDTLLCEYVNKVTGHCIKIIIEVYIHMYLYIYIHTYYGKSKTTGEFCDNMWEL